MQYQNQFEYIGSQSEHCCCVCGSSVSVKYRDQNGDYWCNGCRLLHGVAPHIEFTCLICGKNTFCYEAPSVPICDECRPVLMAPHGRLIDADKLKQHYAWWGDTQERKDFDDIVDVQPTVVPATK